MLRNKLKLILYFLFLVIFNFPNSSFANALKACESSFINPVSDIRWEGIFPITIAGVEIKGTGSTYDNPASEGLKTDPEKHDSIVCICRQGPKVTFGLVVSYWEPARIIETTKVPWCFPTLGASLSSSNQAKNWKNASSKIGRSNTYSSFNSHYYLFNVFDIIDLFVDIPCVPHEGFDVAYVSEIDPMWNNDLLSFAINPEAILFGNPIAQLACAADSVGALAGYPINALFWCVGSWGSSYPLAGATETENEIKASAELAARTIYRNARLGLLWDPGVDKCGAVITPIWIKTHYKMHLIKPKQGPIVPIGRAPLIWETDKNPPFGTRGHSPDNFSWIMFRKVKCCLGMTR
ncbi:MAG: TraU family protein [Brevinematia bacterium]